MTVCHTLGEIAAAGMAAAAKLPPPTPELAARLALILAPFLQRSPVKPPAIEPQPDAEPRADAGQCWTRREVTARLRVSREHLRKLISAGDLEAFKIGDGKTSDLRVTEESIRAFIKRHMVAASIPGPRASARDESANSSSSSTPSAATIAARTSRRVSGAAHLGQQQGLVSGGAGDARGAAALLDHQARSLPSGAQRRRTG